MTSQSLYKKLLAYIRKDRRGLSLTEDEFNLLAPIVTNELFNALYKEWETSQEITDSLAPFKVFNASLTIATNKGDLTALSPTFSKLIGRPRYGSTTVLDVVTSLEYDERTGDALTVPSTTNPVCFLATDSSDSKLKLYVYPTMTPVLISYLSKPNSPFLDYYVNDTTAVVTYLAAGATSQSVPSGSTYRDGTAGPTSVNSATVDPQFGDDLEDRMLDLFLSKVGIQDRDTMLIEQSNNSQQTK